MVSVGEGNWDCSVDVGGSLHVGASGEVSAHVVHSFANIRTYLLVVSADVRVLGGVNMFDAIVGYVIVFVAHVPDACIAVNSSCLEVVNV